MTDTSQPSTSPGSIPGSDDVQQALAGVARKLSPRGDVVSERSRQRTIAVFGQPLTPQQVVERICRDVQPGGLAGPAGVLAKSWTAPA